MNTRRKLGFKIAISILVAMVISLFATWFTHDYLCDIEAEELIDSTMNDMAFEMNKYLEQILMENCFEARDKVEAGCATDPASLSLLARKLQVTEVSVVGEDGFVKFSSNESLLATDKHKAFSVFDATELKDVTAEIINGDRIKICLDVSVGPNDDDFRKYAITHLNGGGIVGIGCDRNVVKQWMRSAVIYIFKDWVEGGNGGVVVTMDDGLILADYKNNPSRAGSYWKDPDDSYYWGVKKIDGFNIYVVLPKEDSYGRRNILVAITSFLNVSSLVIVAILVGVVISRFVREQVRAQAEKEMAMATSIQLSVLPKVFPPFPDEGRFDIWASMDTAKEVGGDFYDFYFTNSTSLFFVIADVSGKGIPAAMFMMRAKAILKAAAQTGASVSNIVAQANDALCEGNTSNTFVTMWVGELDVETGEVRYVNAGHNPPVVRHNGKLIYLSGVNGLALGAMPGVPYCEQKMKLKPGDAVYLYTDGVTEQSNMNGELYGEERLLKALENYRYQPREMLKAIGSSIRAFAGERDQDDDCTQLIVRYRGPSQRVLDEKFSVSPAEAARATECLDSVLGNLPEEAHMTVMVAADEIIANITNYSHANQWSLAVDMLGFPNAVRLVIRDDGRAFDPLSVRDPDTTLAVEDRDVGGLGMFIVKKTMSPLTYSRKNGLNILTMTLTYHNS